MIKCSVITLTQDRPEWLDEAIRSVEAQTDRDWEHLVYDNGSRDPRVAEVLRAARARQPTQFFYTSPGGRGPDLVGWYWNVLLGLARGRYVTILDDDNRKRPTFLMDMTWPMEVDSAIDAVSCGWSPIDERGECSGEDRHWNLLTTMPKLWQSNTIDSNALVFRRSVIDRIGQFDPQLTTNEDWHFVIRLARACRIAHLGESLLDYRVHASARSRRAVELGARANWERIRRELFTDEERRIACAPGNGRSQI
jgi:glycosyltransferase involved in cell wall biosynthesis